MAISMGGPVFWSPDVESESGDRSQRGALLDALRDVTRYARLLEDRAEVAKLFELGLATSEEGAVIDALGRCDHALVRVIDAEPHLLGRQALADVGVELDAAGRALHAYIGARRRSDRREMLAAARALSRAGTLATAIFDEAGLLPRGT